MRRTLWSLPGALALASAGGAFHAEAQVAVNATWLYPAETIFFSDFDPFSPGRQPDLFSIDITNGGGQTAVLTVRVSMIRPNTVFIFEGETNPFPLSGPILRLTNRDLATTDQPHSIKHFEFGDQADDLNERLRQTGRFPAGTYEFVIEVQTPQGIVLGRTSLQRELANPTRVDLLGPGRPFGEPPPVVTSPAPRFLWTTDSGLVLGLGEYRLRVARVDDAASGEEAIRGFPVWETVTTATSATYPGSAQAISLAPGSAYAWQVAREVRTSGGIELLESPIYWFRMAAAAGGSSGSGSGGDETASRQIRQLAELLGLGPQLDGFEPRGAVLVDGVPTSMDALQDLLRRIISGEATVLSITVR